MRLSLTLAEAFTGVSKDVKILRRAPCTHCARDGRGGRHDAGDVPALRRARSGHALAGLPDDLDHLPGLPRRGTGRAEAVRQLRRDRAGSRGRGAAGRTCRRASRTVRRCVWSAAARPAPQGGRNGNLYVILRVQGDERFERDGADLHAEVAVSFPQLALGDTVEVPTLDGEGALDIPPGTQPGETVVLRGRGMPRLDGRGRGDIVAHVKLVVPSSMSDEEEAHLRAYAASGGQRVSPERGGFFKRKKKK